MKRLTLISLALAAALTISPAAFAQAYDWGFDAGNGTVSVGGLLNVIEVGHTDQYDITSGTIGGIGQFVTGSRGTNSPSGTVYTGASPAGGFNFDNIVIPAPLPPTFDTLPLLNPYTVNGGLLFQLSGGGYIYITGTDTSCHESNFLGAIVDSCEGSYYFDDTAARGGPYRVFGDFSLTPVSVPEYGSISMLLLSIVALAGGFFCKAKHSGLLLSA